MNPLLQCKPTILPLFIAGVLACFGLLPKAQQSFHRQTEAIPASTRQRGKRPFLASPRARGTRQLDGLRSRALLQATSTRQLALPRLCSTPQTKIRLLGQAHPKQHTHSSNTATGAVALFNNVGLGAPSKPTGILFGSFNTANGDRALFSNANATRTQPRCWCAYGKYYRSANTVVGISALSQNKTADQNTAVGAVALFDNTTGTQNTAVGFSALHDNTEGFDNTAIGASAANKRPAATTSISVRACLVPLVSGACYSRASLANRLPADSRFSLIRPISLYHHFVKAL